MLPWETSTLTGRWGANFRGPGLRLWRQISPTSQTLIYPQVGSHAGTVN